MRYFKENANAKRAFSFFIAFLNHFFWPLGGQIFLFFLNIENKTKQN